VNDNLKRNLIIFKNLLWKDWVVFSREFWGKLLNTLVWLILLSFAFGYIVLALGVVQTYGSFVLVSYSVMLCFYVGIARATSIVDDFNGVRYVDYELTIPVSNYLIFGRRIVENLMRTFIFSFTLLPIGKLMLWNRFSLEYFSILTYSNG
jgi:hypothetical protein